jgi:hypothetical protein
MIHRIKEARWRELESHAHLSDVQELIRQEIQNGAIRVRPRPGGGIRILPVVMPESEEPIEAEPPPAPSQEESPPIRVARRGRLVPQ